jgi:hypothetical protein
MAGCLLLQKFNFSDFLAASGSLPCVFCAPMLRPLDAVTNHGSDSQPLCILASQLGWLLKIKKYTANKSDNRLGHRPAPQVPQRLLTLELLL